ncbi:MAG: glutamine--fructose-6-phosphate transaminase (isomerizing) [Clostridia bacterium]|nr:glutamine--fructose-6-phosphate transaminase (isomerizing) [Clostridia bacterium]
MCGIYGYVGKNALQETIRGIKDLEYRGYDSAGIAFINKNNFKKNNKKYQKNIKKGCKNLISVREKGEIKHLDEILNNIHVDTDVAISHTRWATHGEANIENSHPHFSADGKWAVVHNGIIENYEQLKNELVGVEFASQTDTEVVAHLLQKHYNGNPLVALGEVCKKLKGSFALAIINVEHPNKIYVARKNSPAFVGVDKTCGVVCSDVNSMKSVENIFLVGEENIAVIECGNVEIYNFNLNKLKPKKIVVDKEFKSSGKENYPHFMLKEIEEIPKVLFKTIEKYKNSSDFLEKIDKNCIKDVDNLLIVGCGTAYNAGRIGGEIIEKECGIKVDCVLASELMTKAFLYNRSTLAVFISQSGETADTLRAVELCKQHGLKCLAVTNVKNSSITRFCDYVIYTYAGAEIAVASTKAFNCQVAVMFLLSAYFKYIKQGEDFIAQEYRQLLKVVGVLEKMNIDDVCKQIAEEIQNEKSLYMIGRGQDYLLAEESSLKLKEISYIHSEAYPAGELKHGTISLVEMGTFVFAFATTEKTLAKMAANIKEVQSRGAKVIALSQYKITEKLHRQIVLENLPEKYLPIVAVVYMQRIAYYTSVMLGNNPDKPRSLAKSVTVE